MGYAPDNFTPLLRYLADASPGAPEHWRGWNIAPVAGGANNLLYHAASVAGQFAVKFTIRDDRDRAGREYAALQTLAEAGLDIAPLPVLLDRESYPQPVVLQTWLHGEPLSAPPFSDDEWHALLEQYYAIRSITPRTSRVPLRDAVTNASSAAAGRAQIQQQLDRIPAAAQPAALRALLDSFDTMPMPEWPAPALTLCRVDANWRNFIRRDGAWGSVDWENSGWGDPAFEMAELMAHPAYEAVPPARWHWLKKQYARHTNDTGAPERIAVYYQVMLVWWVARLARSAYDSAHGQDQRLTQHPALEPYVLRQRYERYLARAQVQLAHSYYDTE